MAIDPAVNGAIAVIIPFVAKDNADIKSVNKGTEGQAILNLTAAPVTVNGLVWSDNNGNGVQDEGETGTNAGGLFVNLLDGTDKIVTSSPVEIDGLYSLPDVPAHATGYMLVLAATNSAKAPSLPNRDWVNTGDHIGVGNKANQGSTLGMIELATSAENVDNQNFGIQNINPLPVKLISFKAHASENKVELDWTTTEEENFSHFEVQRSANGQSFTTFHQESNTGLYRYHTSDSQPLGGDNYYRLKMVDYDGSYAFSRTEVVKWMTATTWAIYPNPAFDELTLTHTDKTIESTKVLDVSGRILKYSLGQAPIQVTDLPAGTYILQALFSDRTVQTKKFVVTR
ncbi:putative secreted protein (Por secretion system target) [Dyadobacter jejuensis]|uniref:Putative secreted protein (Por secretion system target) n=1 Tax=Dyadobacter jejuensis TaxID=1082580 RepID=A0A316AK28_9BACT|nr:putative secreted protein (Por secretion system target) [Dyadobacter jejuensis]